MLDNFDNLQASWVTQGGKVGQLSLAYGANDMGSVMIEENVVRAAGASYCMDEVEIVRNIEDAGLRRRSAATCTTSILGDPIFRERDVPRMLELATARADGDTSVPGELRELSGAQPVPARQLRIIPQLIRYHAVLDPADSRAADHATAGSSSIAIAIAATVVVRPCAIAGVRPMTRREVDLGEVARAAGPGQRAHAPRAVVSSRRGAAGRRSS